MIYTGGGLQTYSRVPRPDSDGNIGQVRAIKLTDQSEMWQYRQYAPVTSSTLPTGGGVVFVGTLDRKLLAFDDETGEAAVDQPDAQQLARVVPDHLRGWRQAVRRHRRELGTGLGRLQSLTPDVKLPPDNPATVYVFALPD